jgi:tRNA threonylcarbamoyladenosine biosynthesis protein TsaB
MRILAVETSGRHGSLAVLSGEANGAKLLRETSLGGEQRTAQALAPALRDLLAETNWPPASIGMVAVAVGPGSFTGLRIGVTTAKAFAYAVSAEIVGVNTLEVLAWQAPQSSVPLWAIMEAQRQELFAAKFEANDAGGIMMSQQTRIIPQDEWLAGLHPGDRITGPALGRLLPRLPAGIISVVEDQWQPTAAAVGKLAWQLYQAGQRDDVWKLAPAYYRPSAAEEKRARVGRQ